MSKFIVLGVALAMLSAGAITTAFKLTHGPARAAPGQHPAILHGFLQRSPGEMALP